MTDAVRAQYEVFPYPARDPADEARRLMTGSPSLPTEIDHYLFGGQRDWSEPLRALVAGGGTGDGLIQLAQLLTKAGAPYEITYLDPSQAARRIAEARAEARALTGITFLTESLMAAPGLGPFDYIDCCGVLHHLDDPVAGFAALRAALAPGGGIGFMVYAPYGRSGVYPLQEAYGTLLDGLPPKERVAAARDIQARLPEGHPFRRNPHLGDHEQSDAGFYDLLLHSRDRAFTVADLYDVLAQAGLSAVSLLPPALYDLTRFTAQPEGMDDLTAMALAEKLGGTLKTHVGYAVPAAEARGPADPRDGALIPVLRGPAKQLAQQVARAGRIPFTGQGQKAIASVPKSAAPLAAAIDGHRALSDIARVTKTDAIAFGTLWPKLAAPLAAWGLLHYSSLGRRR